MPHESATDQVHPTVHVLLASLTLVALYLVCSIVVTLALSAASMSLHPATRLFIWLVMTTAVGLNLLRRHRRYPSPQLLALILLLSISMLLTMSVAAMLRLAAGSGGFAPQFLSFALNALGLFAVGAGGLYLAQQLFNRRASSR